MGHDARWWKAGAMLLSSAVGVATSRAADAAGGPPPVPSRSTKTAAAAPLPTTADQALGLTSQTGRPTLLVLTSRSEPDSQRLWEDLAAWVQKGGDRGWSVARLSLEADAEPVRRLGVTRFPTVIVYRKGSRGVEAAGSRVQPRDAAEVLAWLGSTNPAVATNEAKSDPAVGRTGLFHHPHAQPSPQTPAPSPAPAAAAVPAFAPVPAPILTASPAAMPAQAPVVLATAPPPIVLQQAPQTVYVAPPAQPANIVVLAPPPAAPSVSVVQPSGYGVAAGSPSLFLADPAASAVVAASPAVAPVALTTAIAAPAAAPASSTTAIAAIPAGPVGRFFGWIGERLVRFKYPRIMTTTTTTTTATTTAIAAPAATVAQPYAAVPAAAPASYPSSQR